MRSLLENLIVERPHHQRHMLARQADNAEGFIVRSILRARNTQRCV